MKALLTKKTYLGAGLGLLAIGGVVLYSDSPSKSNIPVAQSIVKEAPAPEKVAANSTVGNTINDAVIPKVAKPEPEVPAKASEPDENTLTAIDLQERKVEFSSVSDINEFLKEVVDQANPALMPLIRELENNDTLRQEWLSWLSLADSDDVIPGAEIVLATLPMEDLVNFASNSLAFGNNNVVAATMAALAKHSELDVSSSGLADLVVNTLKRVEASDNTKVHALNILAARPDSYSDAERGAIAGAVSEQFVETSAIIQSEAVNTLLKLDPESQIIEDYVLTSIQNEDTEMRKRALERLDYRLELGLELTPLAVSTIHYQILNDLNGGIEFAEDEDERESYMHTAAYILGNLQLSQTQIYEMEAAGLTVKMFTEESQDPEPTS